MRRPQGITAKPWRRLAPATGRAPTHSCAAWLKSLLPSLAEIVAGKRPKEVQAALDNLQAEDFLVEGENSALRGLWSLSQPRGSHPGLSSESEARFRLMAVTAHCRFLLERLPD